MFIGAKNNVEVIRPAVCITTFRPIYAISHRLTSTNISKIFHLIHAAASAVNLSRN